MAYRILIVGQAPSRTGDSSRPLEGRAGRLIAGLAGVEFQEYLELTERVNLFGGWTGRRKGSKGDLWNALAARQSAARLRKTLSPMGEVILLGRNVAGALGFRKVPWLTWIKGGPWELIGILPHPSGIVRWWNSEENCRFAAAFLGPVFARAKEKGGRS